MSDTVDHESIRDQLDRIVTSSQLEASPSLCRFLRFVVEETLAGRSGSLKEYSLGTEVFDRGDEFDPRMDPIVRVQARNLRNRLAQYYAGPGEEDTILIDLPKRTYVPVFQVRKAPAEEPAALIHAPAPPVKSEAAIEPATRSVPASLPAGDPSRYPNRVMPAAAIILVVALFGSALLWQGRRRSPTPRHESDPQAQDLYIRGRYLMDRQSESALRAGIACFQQAITSDPQFAAAHAGMADGYNVLAQYGYIPPAEGMEQARRAAERALDIDPGLAEGHVSLAAVLEAYDWNWKAAEHEYRRAIEINPWLASAHLWYGMFLRDQGRLGEALRELRWAAQLEPFSVMTSINLAHGLMMAGNYATALEQARHVVEIAPEVMTAQVIMANAHHAQKQDAEADAALDRARRWAGDNPHGLAMLARAYARYGNKVEGQRLFNELTRLAQRRYVSPFDMGTVSLALGDEDRALTLLQEAFRQRSSGLIFLRDASFSRMQRVPEFHSLVEKMRFTG